MSERCVDFFDMFLFRTFLVEEQSLNYSNQTTNNMIYFKVIEHKQVDVVQK